MIQILSRKLPGVNRLPLKFDDDVAAVPLPDRTWMIVKSDMLLESSDVPSGMSFYDCGWKAVVSTVSDFAAKGVRPLGLLVSLGLQKNTRKKEFLQLASGLASASREYDCPIVGGDTNESKELVVDVSGFGVASPGKIVRRHGARPGDIVAVTGLFGNSAAGLRLMLSKRVRSRDDRVLERAVTRPRARLKEGLALARTGVVTSSIDSSDGLAWSLHQLAASSKVGIQLDRVPVAGEAGGFAMKQGTDPLELALYGGEEYELVVTIKKDGFPRAKRVVPSLIRIGNVVEGSGVARLVGRKEFSVKKKGWEHFTSSV